MKGSLMVLGSGIAWRETDSSATRLDGGLGGESAIR